MTLGPIMLDLMGLELQAQEREILQHPLVGGIILFSRNYESPDQLRTLIKEIRAASHTRLLIAVDHEGGRVQRFREGFTALPSLKTFGEHYLSEPEKTKSATEASGYTMASELRAFDIDFSFAPVLDLNKEISSVIGDRSFHRKTHIVIDLAKSYIDGMKRAGMPAVGKHFPGHGSVAADSHIAIPIDHRNYAEIKNDDLIPFAELIAHGIQGIMPAHIVYPECDAQPAGFSAFWLQKILREELKFNGVIFSDDLTMAGAAIAGDVHQRVRSALLAGCDMLLICNDQLSACAVLDNFDKTLFSTKSAERLLQFTT